MDPRLIVMCAVRNSVGVGPIASYNVRVNYLSIHQIIQFQVSHQGIQYQSSFRVQRFFITVIRRRHLYGGRIIILLMRKFRDTFAYASYDTIRSRRILFVSHRPWFSTISWIVRRSVTMTSGDVSYNTIFPTAFFDGSLQRIGIMSHR